MPVDPNADIEISAFEWVPDFAKGLVRDLRVRWALEEAGCDYRVRLLNALEDRPEAYFREQPFGQVPIYRDGELEMFESGAIVLHIGGACETLLPRDTWGRARAMSWVVAALNSVEPMLIELAIVDIFAKDEKWAKLRRPSLIDWIRQRLGRLSDALGEKEYLEDRFTAGDLMMTTVLRNLRHTDIVAEHPTLAAYQKRCESRPAFRRALEAQLAAFAKHEPAAVV